MLGLPGASPVLNAPGSPVVLNPPGSPVVHNAPGSPVVLSAAFPAWSPVLLAEHAPHQQHRTRLSAQQWVRF